MNLEGTPWRIVFRIDEAEGEILDLDCDVLVRRLPRVRMAKPFHPGAFIRMYIIELVTDAAWKKFSQDQNRAATEIILERKKCGD